MPEESIATEMRWSVLTLSSFMSRLFVLSQIVDQSGAFNPSTYFKRDLTNPSYCLKGRWKRT